MSEKIAVHCETEEEWERVKLSSNKCEGAGWGLVTGNYPDHILCIKVGREGGFDDMETCVEQGYTIISAEEYLKEEWVKDSTASGIRARVEMSKQWDQHLWNKFHREMADAMTLGFSFNKINIDKEDTMKKAIEDNFEKTKDANLVEAELGEQITDNFIQGLVIKQFSKEILAEAKRLKNEREEK